MVSIATFLVIVLPFRLLSSQREHVNRGIPRTRRSIDGSKDGVTGIRGYPVLVGKVEGGHVCTCLSHDS